MKTFPSPPFSKSFKYKSSLKARFFCLIVKLVWYIENTRCMQFLGAIRWLLPPAFLHLCQSQSPGVSRRFSRKICSFQGGIHSLKKTFFLINVACTMNRIDLRNVSKDIFHWVSAKRILYKILLFLVNFLNFALNFKEIWRINSRNLRQFSKRLGWFQGA